MARNIEIKARVANVDALRHRIAGLDTKDHHTLQQCDTFYEVPAGRLKLREIEAAQAQLIFYERDNIKGTRQSNYTVTRVPDAASMHELLGRMYPVKAVVRKTRNVWIYGQTRIHLDRVESLGDFMELEVVLTPDQSAAEGDEIAQELMTALDIKDADLYGEAYVDLLHRTKT